MDRQLTFFDFFSGIGGFKIGLERAGFKCAGFCDNDENAVKLYRAFFKTDKELYFDDITKINTKDLPDFDIFCGGFPCQSFSIAGKRLGFNDTRGTMFFEVARILKDKRPRYFILENVKGLLNHNGGKTFQTILKILSDLGYQTQWQLLNSKFFGVPQNRERVYIVGSYGTECIGKIFPITDTAAKNICNGQKEQLNSNIPPSLHQVSETSGNPQGKRIYTTDGISPCITASHGNQATFINQYYHFYTETKMSSTLKAGGAHPMIKVRNGTKKGYDEAAIGDGINLAFPNSKTRRGRVGKGCSQTLDTHCNMGTFDGCHVRRLTPLECFRLQGFPDEMVKTARELGLADGHLYKMAGNAVTVNVVETIAKKLADVINNKDI